MFTVVSYDIICDRRRAKIANTLKNYGQRVQKSVFECTFTRQKFEQMVRELLMLINREEDSLRIYRLCEGCRGRIKIYGLGKVLEDEEVFIV